MGQPRKIWRQLPNAITVMRLALIVVFVIFFYYIDRKANPQMHSRGPWMIASMAVYALACITDFLDGWIARKYKLISDTGKLLDPLADKLMLIIIMFCFWLRANDPGVNAENILPIWVIIVLAAKEVVLVAGGMVLYVRDVVVHSKFLGKLATAILMVGVGLAFLWEYLGGWHLYLIYAGLALTIAGFFQYGIDTLIQASKRKKAGI